MERRTRPATMSQLPTELLAQVFSYLCGWELLVVEQVCEGWKEVVRKWIWDRRRTIALKDVDPFPYREPFRNVAYEDAASPIPVYSEEDTLRWIHNVAEIGSRMATVDKYPTLRPQFALREGYPLLSGDVMDWGEPPFAEQSRHLHSQALELLFRKRSPSFEYSWEQLDSLGATAITTVHALCCDYPPSPPHWSSDDKRASVFHASSGLRKLRISNPRSCWGDISFDLLSYVQYIIDVCPQIASVEFDSVLVALDRSVDIIVHLTCPVFSRNAIKRLMKCFNAMHDDSDESDDDGDDEGCHVLVELLRSGRVRSATIDMWNTAPSLRPEYLIRVLEDRSPPDGSTEALLRAVLVDMTEELFLSDGSVPLLQLLRDTGVLQRLRRFALTMGCDYQSTASSPIEVMELLSAGGCLQRMDVLAIHLKSDSHSLPRSMLTTSVPVQAPPAIHVQLQLRQLLAKGHISLPHLISIIEHSPRLQQLVIELPGCDDTEQALALLRPLLHHVVQLSQLDHLSVSMASPSFSWTRRPPPRPSTGQAEPSAPTRLLTLEVSERFLQEAARKPLLTAVLDMVPPEFIGRIVSVRQDGSTTATDHVTPETLLSLRESTAAELYLIGT